MTGRKTEENRVILNSFIDSVHRLAIEMGVAVMILGSIDDDVAIQFVGDNTKSLGVETVVTKTGIASSLSNLNVPLRFEVPVDSLVQT